ncbi:O-antigen ligase family protein [Actinomycetospora sp. NBRC 106378]|uniref:O-antigen ligase family protein n=1 Tax=Actinomycetospora sp. NBRC 106378 TaxID=3032208 RepID=UPI0024A1D283|nr:O-antigen ligase family protein [Actinomycetospora sp. NBRC 106378]GLZ51780.1 hypothetical protein Acsp07_13970 [Actinomycetospora sp. NBRC 106378]
MNVLPRTVPAFPAAAGGVLLGVLAAGLAGVALADRGVVGLLVVAVLTALVAATLADRAAPLYVALALGLTALPAVLTSPVRIGPLSVLPFEPFLYLGAALLAISARPRLPWALWALAGVVGLGTVVGVVVGNPIGILVSELRPTVDLLVGAWVACAVVRTPTARRLLMTAAVILWTSLPLTMLGSLGLIRLGGREESAVTGGDATSGEAVRLLTPAVTLAFVAVIAAVALVVTGRVALTRVLPWLLPAVPIVVLAFTRGHILGFVASAVFVLVVLRRWAIVLVAVRTGTVLLVAALGAGLAVLLSPAGRWFGLQLDGFRRRVLDGLGAAGTTDPSVLYREQETTNVVPRILSSPVVGHGFGAAYQRPRSGLGSFFAEQAPYYLHDYYLWLALKVGLLGLAVYLVLLVVPLVRVLRAGPAAPPAAVAAGAVVAAWLVVQVTTPVGLGFASATVAGALYATAWCLAPAAQAKEVSPEAAQAGDRTVRADRTRASASSSAR